MCEVGQFLTAGRIIALVLIREIPGIPFWEIVFGFDTFTYVFQNFDSYSPHQSLQAYPPSWGQQPGWMKYRDIANSVALIGGLAYAVYWFYKASSVGESIWHHFIFTSHSISYFSKSYVSVPETRYLRRQVELSQLNRCVKKYLMIYLI